MPGATTAASISGSLDAKNIAMGVLTQALQLSGLEAICTPVDVPELTATIPVLKPGAVHEDIEELETSDIEGASFAYVDFALKKDRVYVVRSDEAKYKSRAGDPLALQKQSAAVSLAYSLDTKIITALQTSPQTSATGAIWSTNTNSPLVDIGTAVAAIRPYKADFIVMPGAVHAKYMGTDLIGKIGTGNPAAMKGAIGTVPGYDLNIFINDDMTAKSVLVGSSTGVAAAFGKGPVEVREYDVPKLGARAYQIDVFRQVKAPIFKTSGSLNSALYQVTGVIA